MGYDPATGAYGTYRRLQSEGNAVSSSCGKIEAVLRWYLDEAAFARDNVLLERQGNEYLVTVDNELLHEDRPEGLVLDLGKLTREMLMNRATMGAFLTHLPPLPALPHQESAPAQTRSLAVVSAGRGSDGKFAPVHSHATSKSFHMAPELRRTLVERWPDGHCEAIGSRLLPEYFDFNRRHLNEVYEEGCILLVDLAFCNEAVHAQILRLSMMMVGHSINTSTVNVSAGANTWSATCRLPCLG